MDIKILLKLSELKKQEINTLRNDFSTLDNIVISLEKELNDQSNFTREFIQDYANNKNYNNNPISILNGRVFLQDLNVKNRKIESNKLEAELQKAAAFESLSNAVFELRKLTKLIVKQRASDVKVKIREELLIGDTLEMHRHNKASLII